MKNKLLVFAVLFMSSFTLFGQGNGNTENGIYPFAFYVYECDEPVLIEGEYHYIFDINVSPSGHFRGRYHINAKGRGTGKWTGAKYEWNETINDTYNASAGATETFQDRLRLIGQGRASDFFLNYSFHFTINANGDLTVVFDEFEAECK